MLQLKLGKKSDKTRPILVKFASFENRDFVKKNAKNLKGSSYGISEHPMGCTLYHRQNFVFDEISLHVSIAQFLQNGQFDFSYFHYLSG
jgi:hypothetical protein